jgi:hypothetical protein
MFGFLVSAASADALIGVACAAPISEMMTSQ